MRVFISKLKPRYNQSFRKPLASALALALGLGSFVVHANEDPETQPFAGIEALQKTSRERTQWFRDAHYGMFIHWGLYSAAGGYWPPNPETGKKYSQHYAEWIKVWAKVPEPEYGNLLRPLFQPDPDFATKWADLAKAAGMRYAILTSKHHEGYTLFNSKAEWSLHNPVVGGTNISPPGRDLVKEFTGAFQSKGIIPGFYYALVDWQHPSGEPFKSYLYQHTDELASNYGNIGVLWPDYSSAKSQGSYWGTKAVLENWQKKQPRAIYNNRFWNGLENDRGDFFTPEKYVPPTGAGGRAFEVCHTLNESFGFSYHDQNWKTPRQVLELLTDITSKGGNLLLNIGPDRFGRVPEPAVKTLLAVGAWLQTHGDSIYGTTASPFGRLPFEGRSTKAEREGKHYVYLHLYQWPAHGVIHLDRLKTDVLSARLLGDAPVALRVESKAGAVIHLPALAPADDPMPVVELTLAAEPEVDLYPHPTQKADRSLVMQARDARIASESEKPNARVQGDHIGYWTTAKDRLEFTFRMDNPHRIVHTGGTVERLPGEFDVILDAACATGNGGILVLKMGDQTCEVEIQPTGGWDTFVDIPAGRFTFANSGEYELHAQPKNITGQGIVNLRKITLVPKP